METGSEVYMSELLVSHFNLICVGWIWYGRYRWCRGSKRRGFVRIRRWICI